MKRELETMRIRLLGGFRVSVGALTIGEEGWRLKRARNLVKLLALTKGHRLHRDQIVERLWPDSGPGSAANSLRQAVHVARRALGAESSLLRFVDGWLELCPDGDLWVDVEAFEEAASVARRSRDPAPYLVAVDLYAGDLLPQDRYEAWAEHRREGLRRMYFGLLLELGELYEKRGQPEAAIEILGRALEAEPAHEGANLLLMRLYSSGGRNQEAILQYERLRKALSEGLGVQPGEATRHLYEQIRVGHAGARQPAEGSRPAAPSERLRRHNLPAERTSFVGRDREIVEVERLLSMTRVLTLTGAGGSGKTRFAMAVARRVVEFYPDGVWFVELASLSDGTLIPQAVAAALDVDERSGQPVISTLREALYRKKLLLILDNCEHLIEPATWLVETLLDSCPGLRVLATSRESLNVAGELVWSVSPLSVPEEGHSFAIDGVAGYGSVRLFAERAKYRDPAFALSPENVEAVATICRRLDGIPLAIELAAAKVGGLSLEQIADRLEGSLGLLAGGNRTAPPRQQTLEGALDWGYELLEEQERTLFVRLSVFAGGWTLGAAEAVGAGDGIGRDEVLGLLLRLVDKSLVVAGTTDGSEPRYGMLEPVRQYAYGRLERGGEVRRRHATMFLALAEEAKPELRGVDQEQWLDRLELEHDNLRSALGWTLENAEAEPGLRFVGALGAFWHKHGHLSEGRRWLERALARSGVAQASERARALSQAGWMAMLQGDYERSVALVEEGLMLFRRVGDRAGSADALCNLGWAAFSQNELDRAAELAEEAMALAPTAEDTSATMRAYQVLGLVAMGRHDNERAAELHRQGLSLARSSGDGYAVAASLMMSASSYLGLGDHERVADLSGESLQLSLRSGMTRMVAANLHLLAASAGMRGQPERSARLWGAAEALRESIGATFSPMERKSFEASIASARARLDGAAWDAAWSEGRAMTMAHAVEFAVSKAEPSAPAQKEQAKALTPREREIAALVARELTNRQIARELVISERTVTTHVHRILKKLGLRSRTHISAWAIEQHLHKR